MRRWRIHLAFGALSLVLGIGAGVQGLRLDEALRVNAAIAGASSSAPEGSLPEARFARALALAAAGDTEAALQAYKELSQGERADLRLSALYNLGNLHLREALKSGPDAAVRALPLIELAKQRYRDLLRSDPQDWDARYNLERALWLSPEIDETLVEGSPRPLGSELAVTTMKIRAEFP